MRMASIFAVTGILALSALCLSCGEKSAKQMQEEIEGGKYDEAMCLDAIESDSFYKREVAAQNMGKYGSKKVVKPLIKHLHKDPENSVRRMCLNGLIDRVKRKEDKAEDLVPEFIKVFKAKDDVLRQRAVEALGDIRIEEGFKALPEMLKDPSPEVRTAAILALAKYEEKVDEVLPLLHGLIKDKEPMVVRKAVKAMADIGQKAAVGALVEALDSDDAQTLTIAIKELGKVRALEGVEKLIELLKSDKYTIRIEAAQALGEIRDERAKEPLRLLCNDQNDEVRKAAVSAIGKMGGGAEFEEMLLQQLDSNDVDMRIRALNALENAKVNSDAFKVKLKIMMDHDANTALRQRAKELLEKIK
jgi:HEAT repeat protein